LQSNKEKEKADKRAIPEWKINLLKLKNINIKKKRKTERVSNLIKASSAAKL